jgi:hypothetical protein
MRLTQKNVVFFMLLAKIYATTQKADKDTPFFDLDYRMDY